MFNLMNENVYPEANLLATLAKHLLRAIPAAASQSGGFREEYQLSTAKTHTA